MTTSSTVPPGAVVLDTNVVSELMRTQPDAGVRDWAMRVRPDLVHTTSITVAEILFGIGRLPAGRRRDLLAATADDVFETFSERILAFDAAAAHAYADIVVEREHAGAPIAGFDAQIAAVTRSHRAVLVTRNTGDFADLDLDLVNPWLSTD